MNRFFKSVSIITAILLTLSITIIATAAISPNGESYSGIDVSVWQGQIDFDAVSESGTEFVYIRAGWGNNADSNFETNYLNIQSTNLKYGFYYYVTALSVEQAQLQATEFAKLISGKNFSARPVMDYEQFGTLDRIEINEVAQAFLEKLEALTGIKPMIYTDINRAQTLWDESLSAYPVWLADYSCGDTPYDAGIWESYCGFQFSDIGNISGISGNVDLDFFYGGALFGSDEAVTPLPSVSDLTYTVVRGDTLWAISQKYGVSISAIVSYNDIQNPNLIYAGQVLKIPSDSQSSESSGNLIYYTVRRGDTLWSISRHYNTTVSAIATLSGIQNPNLIFVGQTIKIDTQGSHIYNDFIHYKIVSGDTLWAISRRYNTTVSAIATLNGIQNPNLIFAGQVIYIP